MTGVASQTGIIDAVIVNWNSGGDLAGCLASLDRHGSLRLAEVVIVDNGSEDGSADGPAPASLRLTVDRVGRNLGFAAGCNRGAARGAAPYLLFLNPDTVIHAGAFDAALGACAPSIGLVGLRQLDAAGRTRRSCSRFPTPLAFWMRALGLDRLARFRHFGPFMTDWPHEDSRAVDQLMGACLLIRRELFAALGGFDEGFFLYYEDVDLALRAQQRGAVSWFEASGTITHFGGGSSRRVKARRLGLSLASRLRYARKHFGPLGFVSVALCTVLVEPWSRLVFAALSEGPQAVREVASGYALLLGRGLPRP